MNCIKKVFIMFNRNKSTLGIMDDLQIAIHSYDGCSKGCSGCLVDTHFKNERFKPILTSDQMQHIHMRVLEYYEWCKTNLNMKSDGYFGKNGFKINHFSYTFRFGNHSELSLEQLQEISSIMAAPYQVFSTAPTEEIEKFHQLSLNNINTSYFLEIIYDPIHDSAYLIRDMILKMRNFNILGYPEILITQRLLNEFPDPNVFVEKCLMPFGDIETQVQFGRYTPSKTRNFNKKQMVMVDDEVTWLAGVAQSILKHKLKIHPIPIAEYAVTLLDEYEEKNHLSDIIENKNLDHLQYKETDFPIKEVMSKTKDIFLSSLYIDHHLDLYIWSESMGQHVLDHNFGFEKLGNILLFSISEIISNKNNILDKMLKQNIQQLIKNPKCSGCSYKSFCSSHAIGFFRKFQEDDGKYCYGYLPVIREFQKDPEFLQMMIDGFKQLKF